MIIKINGEVLTIEKVITDNLVRCDNGAEYYLFADSESAGKQAREYWQDMAEHDPEEFTCMVGQETLIAWALGHYAGTGSTQVCSLEEWLDLWLDTPEEHFAGYDGTQLDVTMPSPIDMRKHFEESQDEYAPEINEIELEFTFGFIPTVAYRHN